MDDVLLKLLEQTGFTDKEAKVYLALLELGQGKVADLSKRTGLKRSIIYVILEGLIKRGYADEIPGGKINAYQAVEPSAILRQAQAVAKNFSEMLPVFQTLRNKGIKRPRIRYVESKEGIWKTYEEMTQSKEAFFISSFKGIEKHFPGGVKRWMKDFETGSTKLIGRNLIPDDSLEIEVGKKFQKLNQKVRVLAGIKQFNMDFTIYGNKLAITSLEDEPFLVLIESEELVNSIRPIFEIAWKSGKVL